MKKNKQILIDVKDIINEFKLEVLNIKYANLNKKVVNPTIHRLGFELAGVQNVNYESRVIVAWGTKEQFFLSKLSPGELDNRLNNIINKERPLILLSFGIKGKIKETIIKIANKNHVAIVQMDMHLSLIRSTIGPYMVEKFAPYKIVHASLVSINGIGVMIIGKSGIGKSEAVLELLQIGHSFVSDDSVKLKKIGNKFIGSSVKLTKGMLEARGIGIVNIPLIYGMKAIKDNVVVELVVELVSQKEIQNLDRLGNSQLTYKELNGQISLMQIPVNKGRSIGSLIETATNVYLARKNGFDALKEIQKRRDDE